MSGACFKGISNLETLTLSMLKHRLLCKWCQTAAKKEGHVKYPVQITPRVLIEGWKDKHFQVNPMILVTFLTLIG